MFQPVLKFWEQLKTDVKVTFNSNRAKNPSLKKPSKNFNWGFNEKKPNPISKIEASSINKEAQAFEKTESENSSSTSKAEKGSGGCGPRDQIGYFQCCRNKALCHESGRNECV